MKMLWYSTFVAIFFSFCLNSCPVCQNRAKDRSSTAFFENTKFKTGLNDQKAASVAKIKTLVDAKVASNQSNTPK
jgi:hypothetical protein